MKIFFYSFFIFIANIGYVYSTNISWDNISDQQIETCLGSETFQYMGWDNITDQQIKSCLDSDSFQNMSLLYFYEDRNWELRIIFNPYYEEIALNNGESSMFQFYYGVFSQDKIPKSLESHLKEIIDGKLKIESDGFWSISSTINERLSIDYFADAIAIPGTELFQTDSQNKAFLDSIQMNQEGVDVDQEIYNLFNEQTFRKLSLNYKWGEKSYLVHFVHNPMREALFCSELSKPVQWPFAMTIAASTYPLSLVKHLKSLVPYELLNDSDSVIDVGDWTVYFRKNSVSMYTTLHPITILNSIDNPDIDVEILTLFTSSQLARKSIYYELDGNFYGILLIHNPETLTLKSTMSFDTWESGHLTHTLTWNSKIGIFVNEKAPQELIDHISQLYELSWWDSFWNLSIHNGDKVSIFRNSFIYKPFSWYTFMLNAELD